MDDPRLLSDEQLIAKMEAYVEDERARLHTFLSWLGEADSRKLLTGNGYDSTFDYCVRRLKLSEDEAYRRIHAARAVVALPELRAALAGGHLSLSAVSKIAPHVGRPDAAEIISQAKGKTARQIDEILAPLHLLPEKRDIVRSVAVASVNGGFDRRVDFSFRGSPELRAAIDRIQELLASKFPFGGLDDVLLEVAREYLERHDPEKGLPGRLKPLKGGASISARLRRAVWARDGARCSYVGPTGVRCLARRSLEMDHVRPRALGGGDTLGNLRLLCRPHNDYERRRILGEGSPVRVWSALLEATPGSLGSPSDTPGPTPGMPRCASP